MPDPNQTPASRRFLPPSSSSRTRQPSSTQKPQFTRPSQVSSSSPFLRTPFHKQVERRDEIETSFEDDDDVDLPSLPAAVPSRGVNLRHKGRDLIEDDENHAIGVVERQSTRPSRFSTRIDDEDVDVDVDVNVDFSSPLPKRQKLSHRVVDAIPISSSPEPGDGGLIDLHDDDDDDDGLENDHDRDMILYEQADDHNVHHQPDPTSPFLHPHEHSVNDDENDNDDLHDPQPLDKTTTKPRFRTHPIAQLPMTDLTQPQPQPQSRLNPKSNTIFASAFKPLPQNHHSLSLSTLPLPATFSPSRRKGRNEYVYQGSAGTVRGWILDVANEQIHGADVDGGNGDRDGDGNGGRRMEVEDVFRDVSGRFDLVRRVRRTVSEEEEEEGEGEGEGESGLEVEVEGRRGEEEREGELWMLVHQEHVPRTILGSGTREVVLKGTGTTWDLDLDLDLPVDPSGESGLAPKVKVAVLWERGRSR